MNRAALYVNNSNEIRCRKKILWIVVQNTNNKVQHKKTGYLVIIVVMISMGCLLYWLTGGGLRSQSADRWSSQPKQCELISGPRQPGSGPLLCLSVTLAHCSNETLPIGRVPSNNAFPLFNPLRMHSRGTDTE